MNTEEYESIKRDKEIIDSLTTMRVNQGLILDTQDYHNKLLEDVTLRQDEQIDYTKQILDIVKPKPKKKSKGIRPRDPLEMSIFDAIMSSPKPKRAHAKSWGRFKITCSILFFGGLRLNEVAALGPSEIEEILEHKKISIYQKKVNKFREVIFIDRAIPFIEKAYEDYKGTVFKKDQQLFPEPPSGIPNGDKFIKLINKYLAPFGKERGLVLKSHSFRVNFITSILRKHDVQNAKELVGHSDIRSTLAYSRYKMTETEKEQILDDCF